jgi:hypothetical protein
MRHDHLETRAGGMSAHQEKPVMKNPERKRRAGRATGWLAMLVVAGALIASGCATSVSRPAIPELSYKHLPSLSLAVSRIEIVEQYQSPLQSPHVEHLFPTPIVQALRRWSDDRLKPAGGANVMRIIVEDASAIVEELETNKDIEAWFTTEQAERVDARLKVRIEITDAEGEVLAFTSTEASRSRTTPENVSLNERDQIYNELTMVLMNDFNASQEQGIRRYLQPYLN